MIADLIPVQRVISRSALANCARAIRQAALRARRPIFVFMPQPSEIAVSALWDERMGELLGVYTEHASVRWVESDLYWHAARFGRAVFIP